MPLFGKQHKTPLGIYVHIPFCRSKCHYCDFYSVAGAGEQLKEGYMYALVDHIKEAGQRAPGYIVDTVYFGGGTPTIFGAEGMAAVLTAIRKAFDVSADAEITFEANPDSVDKKLLKRLRSEGFNRVSLGIQCDNNAILEKIGRPHTYEEAVEAVRLIRKVGFRNLRPEHISCYGLKLEEGTPMHQFQDQYTLADDDTQADMYLAAVQILQQAGYRQYEISNFCKKGHVSRHNLKYWTGGEYLGFGPDASSDFAGRRFTAVRDLHSYCEGILTGGQVLREVEEIARRERAGEYLMMRLRLSSGLDPEEYEKRFLMSFAPLENAMIRYREKGLATKTYDGRWHLTPEGYLLSNDIISDLLLIQENT